MNTMNNIGKVRVRSIEELNSDRNLFITSLEFKSETNLIEMDLGYANILTEMQQSQLKDSPNKHTSEQEKEPFLLFTSTEMQTDTNCGSPTLEIIQLNSKDEPNSPNYNSNEHQVTRIESEENLSAQSCVFEKANFDNVCIDLEEDQSQNSPTLPTALKTFSDNLNIERLQEEPFSTEMQTDINCGSPNSPTYNPYDEPNSPAYNSKEHQISRIESKEKLSAKSCLFEKANSSNVCIDLEEEQSQNSPTSPMALKAFAHNLKIKLLQKEPFPTEMRTDTNCGSPNSPTYNPYDEPNSPTYNSYDKPNSPTYNSNEHEVTRIESKEKLSTSVCIDLEEESQNSPTLTTALKAFSDNVKSLQEEPFSTEMQTDTNCWSSNSPTNNPYDKPNSPTCNPYNEPNSPTYNSNEHQVTRIEFKEKLSTKSCVFSKENFPCVFCIDLQEDKSQNSSTPPTALKAFSDNLNIQEAQFSIEMQTDTNCGSPKSPTYNSYDEPNSPTYNPFDEPNSPTYNSYDEPNSPTYNSNEHQVTRIKSKEKLSASVYIDLEEERSQNSQTPPKSLKAFSDNLNIERSVVYEKNNETDVEANPSNFFEELPDDSFCLMEFVETVFDVECNGDNLKCICAPIQFEIEKDESQKKSEFSRDHDYPMEFEKLEFEKGNNYSLQNEQISAKSKSMELKIDEETNSKPLPQITETLTSSTNIDNNKPIIKSPDKVLLNQFISPHQKAVVGTTFVVDVFTCGSITEVTAIFLTHFHPDHYHNLKGNLSKPIYASKITARLLRGLISANELTLNILDLNNTITVDGVKVTALDSNYCPGAIMLLFQLASGFRILYTGNFHASSEMELNPFLKAEKIDILYLDMAYISRKNNLSLRRVPPKSLEKSISDAIILIRQFKQTHIDKRILFVFGHNVLENEELWLQIADTFNFKVWTDEFRVKILTAIGNEEYIQRLVPNSKQADMHLIQHSSITYHTINDYWKEFKDAYDVMLGIKPNQWVDNRRRLYKGDVNIAEIAYSGHSNETEIRRFLAFLKPKHVKTLVPAGKDHKLYPEVPLSWYKEKWLSPVMKQASMFDFFQVKQKK